MALTQVRGDGLNSDAISTVNSDITVNSEGGAVTTSVVQGLAKAWGYFVYAGGVPSSQDSLNVSSYDDNGTGDAGINFSSSMNNDDFCTVATQQNHGSALTNNPSSGRTTSSTNVKGRGTNYSTVDTEQNWLVIGDLA